MSNIILAASCLYSKYGFEDGDILAETMFDAQLDSVEGVDDHKAIEKLVREYLLPALPDKVETEFCITIHNPVRAVDWPEGRISIANSCVLVEVPHEKVIEALKAVPE